eukprot:GEMP01056430.1.p1 GENE.GEMP01056430.1~~GEMP01056430.1.p1  ORF type:complete len:215 (+),score=68.02 GEMP01056430.1:78-722(+)
MELAGHPDKLRKAAQAFANLPTIRFKPTHEDKDVQRLMPGNTLKCCERTWGNVCSICLESFVVGELVGRVSCGHLLHTACARRWFDKDQSCPTCRAEVSAAPRRDNFDWVIEAAKKVSRADTRWLASGNGTISPWAQEVAQRITTGACSGSLEQQCDVNDVLDAQQMTRASGFVEPVLHRRTIGPQRTNPSSHNGTVSEWAQQAAARVLANMRQ